MASPISIFHNILILCATLFTFECSALRINAHPEALKLDQCATDYFQKCKLPEEDVKIHMQRIKQGGLANDCSTTHVLTREDVETSGCQAAHSIQPSKLPSVTSLPKMKYASCAVVGSSGTLKTCGKAEEISAHEAVIRCNDAPTKGWEKFVGNRTTVRLVNQFVTPEKLHREDSIKIQYEATRVPSFYIMNKYITTLAQEVELEGGLPEKFRRSCGGVSVMYALLNCDKVSMYGYGAQHGKWTHYYKGGSMWKAHGLSAENKWFKCISGDQESCSGFDELLEITKPHSRVSLQCHGDSTVKKNR